MEKITKVRKSGLTFAPEAGTQRMRDVINKNVTEEEVLATCRTAFEGGYTAVKLYFMMDCPLKPERTSRGLWIWQQKVVDLFYSLPDKPKEKVSTSRSVWPALFQSPLPPLSSNRRIRKKCCGKSSAIW